MPARSLALALALTLTGCKAVEPAPKELDDLFHWFYDMYEEGTDEQLAEGVRNLHDVIGDVDEDEPMDGSITRLSQDQVDASGRSDAKASNMLGIYSVGIVGCSVDGMEDILTYEHQDELFDVYETYSRDYTSSKKAYLDRDTNVVEWDASYTTSAIGSEFGADLEEGVRRVPKLDEEQSPFGAFLLLKRVMPEAADFGDSDKTFKQDYKVEIYYKRARGQMVHSHGMWRQADFGAGFDQDSEGVQRLLLNGMHDWDEDSTGQ